MMEIDDTTFNEDVLESEIPVLVDFYTPTCGPCRMLAPVLEVMSQENKDISFLRIDASDSAISDDYDITCVPTLILFREGQEIARIEGLESKKYLEEWLHENLED